MRYAEAKAKFDLVYKGNIASELVTINRLLDEGGFVGRRVQVSDL